MTVPDSPPGDPSGKLMGICPGPTPDRRRTDGHAKCRPCQKHYVSTGPGIMTDVTDIFAYFYRTNSPDTASAEAGSTLQKSVGHV